MNSFNNEGILNFKLTIDPNNYEEDLVSLILSLKPTWSRETLKIKEFSGGLTNKLIGCSSTTQDDETILSRIYGPGTDNYIDRNAEIKNMKILSECKLGPRIYCKFENGICYEFLPGVIVDLNILLNEEVFSKVAQLVAKMHSIKTNCEEKKGEGSILFKKIHGLLNLVPSDYENMLYGAQEDISRIPSKEILRQELDFMENYIEKLCFKNKSRLVFSHNDLLLANIIYNKTENSISFIDFEYSGMNWNAYDIANHFNEYAGVDTVDYNLYPSEEYQLKWLEYYLKALLRTDIIEKEIIERFYDEVNKFALVSHLFWGIWSIVQASYPTSVLNFADYACIRLGEYFRRKKEL